MVSIRPKRNAQRRTTTEAVDTTKGKAKAKKKAASKTADKATKAKK